MGGSLKMEWSKETLEANGLYRRDLKNSGVYVLLLEGGYMYVGQNVDISRRICEHLGLGVRGDEGAKWTMKHKPIGRCVVKSETFLKKCNDIDEQENIETLLQMREHGICRVRGGSWCQVEYPVSVLRELIYRYDRADEEVKKIEERSGESIDLGYDDENCGVFILELCFGKYFIGASEDNYSAIRAIRGEGSLRAMKGHWNVRRWGIKRRLSCKRYKGSSVREVTCELVKEYGVRNIRNCEDLTRRRLLCEDIDRYELEAT